MALQRVFPIIDVFIYLHCCKAGQAAPQNSNSIFDLLDKWVRYQMNGRANKWAKPQIWTCWEHMKPPTATANLLLASFHSGSHLCLSGMPISLACWPHYSPTLQLLNPQPALEKKTPKKHMPIYFCFTLFNIRDEENVFLCNYLIYLDLEYIKAVGGTVKKKKEGIYRSEKSVLCLKN